MTTRIRLRGDAMTIMLLIGRDRNIANGILFALGGTLMKRQLRLFYTILA